MADSHDSPGNKLENEFDLIERQAGDKIEKEDADRLIALGESIYEGKPYPVYEVDGEKQSFTAATTRQYLLRLRCDVLKNGHRLTDIDPEAFNQLMADLDETRARSTTTQAQSAAKAFYRLHDDLGVDPEAIEIFEEDSSQKEVDPEDIITHEELEALRQEVETTVMPYRNRALLEMMVYTGQRIRALQTLQIKDVHPEEKPGYINLNDDVEGLKDATERGRYRPLLAARKYVREWKERHPRSDDPEAWFFVGQPNHPNTNLDQPWSAEQMRKMLYRAAGRAGFYDSESDKGKKPNPHSFRHYWYTSMRRDPNQDPEDLKAAGGWSESSNTPELVYKNFTDEEHMERIERGAGFREEDEEARRFIPETCPICGEPLKPHWKECPACEEPFVEEPLADAQDDTLAGAQEGEEPELSKLMLQELLGLDGEEFEAEYERLKDRAQQMATGEE